VEIAMSASIPRKKGWVIRQSKAVSASSAFYSPYVDMKNDLKIILLDELSPLQIGFILILSPVADLALLDFHNERHAAHLR
jgi:hypothetical protein